VFEDLEIIRTPETVKYGDWGGDNNRLMTEEEQFHFEFFDTAKKDPIISAPELHNEYNKRIGKVTPKSTIY
jgi:hypothetical protein